MKKCCYDVSPLALKLGILFLFTVLYMFIDYSFRNFHHGVLSSQPSRPNPPKKTTPSRSIKLDPTRFTKDPDATQYLPNSNSFSAATISKPVLPRSLNPNCLRALVSPIGDASSDGLGHRVAIIIFELNLAALLDVAYLHRVSPYGSLTAKHPSSVQRLFGWSNYPDLRTPFLRKHCVVTRRQIPGCKRTLKDEHEYCMKLRPASPFRRIVTLPQNLTECLGSKTLPYRTCLREIQAFGKRHAQCGALFQALPSRCSFDYTTGSTNLVGRWLRARYWTAHASSTQLLPPSQLQRPLAFRATRHVSRVLPFRNSALQIAVHVRRGDLFLFKHRVILSDAMYAYVIATAVAQARIVFGQTVRINVSVFSEGSPPSGERMRSSSHDVAKTTQTYMTEKGTRVRNASAHWTGILRKALKKFNETGKHILVNAFIATDTVVAIHTMLCADVFVGSVSGLSYIVGAKLGRGVILLPRRENWPDVVERRTVYFGLSKQGGVDEEQWLNSSNVRRAMERLQLTRASKKRIS